MPKCFEKKNGKKKSREIGIPTKILFAKITVFSTSLCSKYEKAIEIILAIGIDMIKPARDGFLNESQLAKEIIMDEIKTLKIKNIDKSNQKSFLSLKSDF